jgi:DNA-binding LytR/AlgR family response regulator
MKVFIAEDEPPARERLIETLARVAPQALVVGSAASVRDTRAWLAAHAAPDVLLLDIQLADGLSIELFGDDGALALPTIFTTAYDEYALAAFRALAIDYLLKPVEDAQLARAFARLTALRERFAAADARALQAALHGAPAIPWRQRWVARKGASWVALPADRVAYFVSADKLSFVVAHDGARYLLDESLAEIESALDPQQYFRVNRQMIVAASAVARWRSAGKGRLVVELAPATDGEVSISQERAAAFRDWLAR